MQKRRSKSIYLFQVRQSVTEEELLVTGVYREEMILTVSMLHFHENGHFG